ncbi:MAG: hypothetical protein ACI978_002290 [Oleispira sp.]|jgi:hypothetical protein
MINRSDLLKDLQRELPKIEKDILEYSESKAELAEHLQEEYEKAQAAGRTAEHFVAWREAQITQAAVAWLLTCVFVRFLEDNNLLVEAMLSGPASSNENGKETKPLQYAKERMVAFFNENPTLEERDYLLDLFAELERFPIIAELLDHRHNPLWQIPVSSDGAKALIDFFQKIDAGSGEIIHDFTDADWDTRFLGDLYQDLSESVRKRYALLQTPEFVESFILDYTLEKAKDTFGLPGLRLIDPTCGSGHFLLSTFERMFDAWQKREPGTNSRELAQRALDVVHGVDINPYAIAICRFRLFIAAMKAAGSHKVKDAPDFHFNLACGDSLLHGRRFEGTSGLQASLMEEDEPLRHVLDVEDLGKLNKILGQQYHAVVGNPPYITASDEALNAAYREKYTTCFRKFSLGVPFTERFFDLSMNTDVSGYIGMITSNSFIKREFGKKLIEKYLPNKDLTHVIDTSGCFIPGHGTPTLIMFARNRPPVKEIIRCVLGIKGEPSQSIKPEDGKVWNDIVEIVNRPDGITSYVSSEDRPRKMWSSHPWSLEGGGAGEMLEVIESNCTRRMKELVDELGFGAITGEDNVFVGSKNYFERLGINKKLVVGFVEGDVLRNWSIKKDKYAFFPYDEKANVKPLKNNDLKTLWQSKKLLQSRIYFGKNQIERGLNWYEYGYFSKNKFLSKYLISFAFVATHNHFYLNRDALIFKQSAPVIKLPNGTCEEDHLVLLGLLNSSMACFWGRQTFFPKGGFADGKWEERLEWDGTKLKRFPIPKQLEKVAEENGRLLAGYSQVESLAQSVDALAQQLSTYLPAIVLERFEGNDVKLALENAQSEANVIRNKMVALQEELDWLCYQAYGLLDEVLVYEGTLPAVQVGERTFEIKLARELAENGGSNTWFTRHDATQTTEVPAEWPDAYRALIEKRLEVMESERFIKLIEKPEFKRRWMSLEWDKQEQEALKNWLLAFLEKASFDELQPGLLTCAQLADSINKNEDAKVVAQLYTGNEFFESQSLVEKLITDDNLPQMANARLKPVALKKFYAWQETWDKQRQEDAIDREFGVDKLLSDENDEKIADYEMAKVKATGKKSVVVGDFSPPPVYKKNDFKQPRYESIRSKQDVPKERFFSLPGCEKDGDSTLVIGWAGMNHLQRATAIATWYLDRKETDGWEAEKLIPMLVAIDELIPWLKQWHNDIDPEFGERMGDYYEGFLLEEMRMLDVTKDDLLAWEPVVAAKKKAAPKKRAAVKKPATKKTENNTSAETNDTDTNKEQG